MKDYACIIVSQWVISHGSNPRTCRLFLFILKNEGIAIKQIMYDELFG